MKKFFSFAGNIQKSSSNVATAVLDKLSEVVESTKEPKPSQTVVTVERLEQLQRKVAERKDALDTAAYNHEVAQKGYEIAVQNLRVFRDSIN